VFFVLLRLGVVTKQGNENQNNFLWLTYYLAQIIGQLTALDIKPCETGLGVNAVHDARDEQSIP
jgi:hypothetical protein